MLAWSPSTTIAAKTISSEISLFETDTLTQEEYFEINSDFLLLGSAKIEKLYLFDGFESGGFNSSQFNVLYGSAWKVDRSLPYDGTYSAHIKTEDILTNGSYSQLDLDVSLDKGGFIQFFIDAPVARPYESFQLWLDGRFLTPLITPDFKWSLIGTMLTKGNDTYLMVLYI